MNNNATRINNAVIIRPVCNYCGTEKVDPSSICPVCNDKGPDHIADTGKMVDKTPDSDQNLLSEIIAKINEWAEITAELKRQNAELRQSCILYYTEREELKKRLDEANTRIETLVKLVTN